MLKQLLMSALCILGITACQTENPSFESVDVTTFSSIIEQPDVLLVDVRTPEEFSQGKIPGSTNIDVKAENFEQTAKERLVQEKTIAVYCRSGRRSKIAAEALTKMGYKVVELDSGFNGWTAANQPTDRP